MKLVSIKRLRDQPFIRDNPAPELSETLTQYTTFTVLKFLTSTPSLPSQASHYTIITISEFTTYGGIEICILLLIYYYYL